METMNWVISLPSLLIIGFLGMLVHFFKKQIKGETLTEIRNYFNDHFKSTAIAMIVTVISVFGYYAELSTGQVADLIVVFFLGFGWDSILNKWEQKIGE